MRARRVIAHTVVALLLDVFAFLYAWLLVPLDGFIDVREAIVFGLLTIPASVVVLCEWIRLALFSIIGRIDTPKVFRTKDDTKPIKISRLKRERKDNR